MQLLKKEDSILQALPYYFYISPIAALLLGFFGENFVYQFIVILAYYTIPALLKQKQKIHLYAAIVILIAIVAARIYLTSILFNMIGGVPVDAFIVFFTAYFVLTTLLDLFALMYLSLSKVVRSRYN